MNKVIIRYNRKKECIPYYLITKLSHRDAGDIYREELCLRSKSECNFENKGDYILKIVILTRTYKFWIYVSKYFL